MAKPQLDVFADQAQLNRAAAERFAQLAAEAVAARGRFSVALSGGSTPQALFRLLSQEPFASQVPWDQVHFFWGDERLVPPQDAGSNYGQAQQLLLSQVAVPPDNVHRARGELAPAAAVADYKAQLRRFAGAGRDWPRFDLALMGMGRDGHTASLFPGPITADETQSPVMAVTADYDDRPAHRLTLTPLVFDQARHVIFLVSGQSKAEALAAVLRGPYDPRQWPAQRIQPQPGTLTWMVDKAAASQLPDKDPT